MKKIKSFVPFLITGLLLSACGDDVSQSTPEEAVESFVKSAFEGDEESMYAVLNMDDMDEKDEVEEWMGLVEETKNFDLSSFVYTYHESQSSVSAEYPKEDETFNFRVAKNSGKFFIVEID
jgi:hypothetical protein